MQSTTIPLLMLALCAAAACGPHGDGRSSPAPSVTAPRAAIPAKTVVLTFDDGLRSHLAFVAPLLRRHGFGATFFVTAEWVADREGHLDFAEIAELARLGFEIGNHSFRHAGYSTAELAKLLPEQLRRLEEELANVSVEKPVSFGWPGDMFGPEARYALQDAGYRFARRGSGPEFPRDETIVGTAYDPARNDPLLIPVAGVANREWTEDHFRALLREAVAGKAVVLQFHGVPDPLNAHLSVAPERFEEFVRVLAEEGANVVALRDLERYGVLAIDAKDPLIATRWPRGK